MKKKAVTSETQLILTAPLTWMVWLWKTKIWPWNSFHFCLECSDLGLQMHNLPDVGLWVLICPSLPAVTRVVPVLSLRAMVSIIVWQGCRHIGSWWRQKPIVQKLTQSPGHHWLVGPAAKRETPLTTHSPRQHILSLNFVWSGLCMSFLTPPGKCSLALTTLVHFACLCNTETVQPLSSLWFEQPDQVSNQFSKQNIQL